MSVSDEQIAHEAGQQYQSVSPLAIIAVGMGCASALALAHPLMWWLPFVAMLSAFAALRSIHRSDGALTGKRLAILSISLSLFFLTWATTRMVVGRSIEKRQARVMTNAWLDVLKSGDLYTAHQWAVSGWRRQPLGTVLPDHYESDPELAAEFEKFQNGMIAGALKEASSDTNFRCRGIAGFEGPRNRRLIKVAYEREEAEKGTSPFSISVQRIFDSDMQITLWQVVAVEE